MSHADATHPFALCNETGPSGFGAGVALNFDGGAPEWVKLIPAGPALVGNDTRKWTLANPQTLVDAFAARGLDRPIDFNHAEFLKAPRGEESPAGGWIKQLEIRDGETFGRVEWTPRGSAALNAREYRYLSPAFKTDAQGRVLELMGAGLVNTPNFVLPALNSETHPMFKDLLKKLGLAETATEGEAIAKIDALQTALNSQKIDLGAYVPRADYELAFNRANTAEQKLADQAKAAHEAEVAALIEAGVKSGKIAPASKDFYIATCASADGLSAFRRHVAALPSLFQSSGLEGKSPDDLAGGVALNADQAKISAGMGLDQKAFAKHLANKATA